ncbi:MAG: hypothetical protein JO283_02720 [Bradyrhizobium sp.]|nr:hypothetical protein [Bradyrhizobium sp.]
MNYRFDDGSRPSDFPVSHFLPSTTHGVAGFTSAEAYKQGFAQRYARIRRDRVAFLDAVVLGILVGDGKLAN